MANRYFTEEIAQGTACLRGGDAAHLSRVLRTKPGDELVLCDGQGMDYRVTVTDVSGEEILCRIEQSAPARTEPKLRAEVFIGYSKADKMEWSVQKAVELGAVAIHPFLSEKGIVKPKKDKSERLQRVADEAAKQSARGILPKVGLPLGFKEMLQRATQAERVLVFHPEGAESLAQAVQGVDHLALVTGPESGFSKAEIALAKEAGCQIVGLGPRILRCETAPLAALAAVMALRGEWE